MSAARPIPAIDLVERALALLVAAPARAHLLHLAGSAPFAFALAAFAIDFGLRGRPRLPLVAAAGLLALLYLGAKVAQALQALELRRLALGAAEEEAGKVTVLARVRTQLLWQPHALWALPLASLAALPYGWVSTFFQALAVTGDRRESVRLAALWPGQNHVAALLVALCWLVAFVDAWIAMLLAPWLLRTFLGIETLATLAPSGLLDPAPLAAAWALAYLAVSPLGRALQVLRAAEGLDRASGADLRGRLRRLRAERASIAAAAGLIVLIVALAGAAAAAARQEMATVPAAGSLDVARLEAGLDRAFARPEYDWRRRAEVDFEVGPTWLNAFFTSVGEGVGAVFESIAELVARLERWLRGRGPGPVDADAETSAPAGGRTLLLLAIVGVAAALLLVWRGRRRRARTEASALAPPVAAEPVALEDRHADRLASDEWLRVAAELERSGDLRAAARAVQLAALSVLARAGRVRLAAAKTHRDYERELARVARGTPAIVEAWSWTVAAVEPVWYGSHAVGAGLLDELRSRVQVLERDGTLA